jgi:hypothetical protein
MLLLLFENKIAKISQNIWWVKKNILPLHPQSKTRLNVMAG